MTSTRGIQRITNNTVVPVKTPQVQLNSKDPQFDNSLARFQGGVSDTLDAVLDWLNDHFTPAAPTQLTRNTLQPDDETLYDSGGLKMSGAYPLLYTCPTSAIVAGATTTLLTLSVPADAQLRALYINAPVPTAGSATISGIKVGGSTGGAVAQQYVAAAHGPTLTISATASSSFAIPAGTISLLIYIGEVQQ